MQDDAAAPDVVPTGHGVAAEAPSTGTNVPGDASLQLVWPRASEYVPREHGVQSLSPAAEMVPAGHSTTSASVVERASVTATSVVPAMVAALDASSMAADASEVPAARWDVGALRALPEPVSSRVRHGGFVRGAELADHAAFALSPAEAAAMDPCQRLLLERGYAVLHAAALDRAPRLYDTR